MSTIRGIIAGMRGTTRKRGRGLVALLTGLALALAATACTAPDPHSTAKLEELLEDTKPANWEIRPGVELVTVTAAKPGEPLSLYDTAGQMVARVAADAKGRAHIAYVLAEPGTEATTPDDAVSQGNVDGFTLLPGKYILRDDSVEPKLASRIFEVKTRDDVATGDLYESQDLQGVDLTLLGDPVEGAELEDGYQYLKMRDRVQLSAMVRFPDKQIYGDGPWPTVIEYSGYGPSNPHSEEPGGRIARSMGYATVSVNMRGTGCSGGIFDTFNPAQQADGYDIVEIVAHQPWVLHGKVGMVGLSYSGITQLYTAATRPPHLAAVTAQSVIADPWLQQWPSGIYNGGFTRQWLAERDRQSGGGGSQWVQERMDGDDQKCADNVAEHELNMDFEAFGRALEMRPPDADSRDLRELVRGIDTAVFLTGAFQDEQTGPQFGAMLDNFDNARSLKVGLWNGRHPDGYSTMNIVRMFEFLEFYVAERVPRLPDLMRAAMGSVVADNFGFVDGTLEPDRYYDEFGDDYEAALAAYEDEDPIRVVFGNGLGANELGEPGGLFETTFSSWPPPSAEATTWQFGAGGVLTEDAGEAGVDTFGYDPDAGLATLLADYDTLEPIQHWNWTAFPDGKSLGYETAPLTDDLVVAGSGYVDLWVNASTPDADVQVTVSEIRPDGVEYLVQNGWLRLGHRRLDEARSTELEIVHPFTEDVYEPLPGDEMVEAKVEIPAMGHVFRAGSKLRLTVSSPGRNHVTWTFEPPAGVDATTTYQVGRGGATASALVLPVVDDVDVPALTVPVPCPGPRGQACRIAPPITNHSQ